MSMASRLSGSLRRLKARWRRSSWATRTSPNMSDPLRARAMSTPAPGRTSCAYRQRRLREASTTCTFSSRISSVAGPGDVPAHTAKWSSTTMDLSWNVRCEELPQRGGARLGVHEVDPASRRDISRLTRRRRVGGRMPVWTRGGFTIVHKRLELGNVRVHAAPPARKPPYAHPPPAAADAGTRHRAQSTKLPLCGSPLAS